VMAHKGTCCVSTLEAANRSKVLLRKVRDADRFAGASLFPYRHTVIIGSRRTGRPMIRHGGFAGLMFSTFGYCGSDTDIMRGCKFPKG
jgi:hypothetical protein